MNKVIAIVLMGCFSLNAFSMRCGTSLINEGDNVQRMIALCGEPTGQGQSVAYINKDSDGMNYYIHSDVNGTIDRITFSRGN